MKLNLNKLSKSINESKFSKVELAVKCGIDRKTIENVLAGRDPKISTVISLADILGLKISYLFDEDTSKSEVHTEGDYSPASESGDVSVVVGDAVLMERIKALEALVAEKDERIAEYKERIAELKSR